MNYEPTKRRQRRLHSPEFKAQLVDQCLGGASLSAIAVDNGINPNLLRRWVLEHERLGLHMLEDAGSSKSPKPQKLVAPATWLPFVPVKSAVDMPACAMVDPPNTPAAAGTGSTQDTIRLEVVSKTLSLSVHWPTARSDQLASWVRELLA